MTTVTEGGSRVKGL